MQNPVSASPARPRPSIGWLWQVITGAALVVVAGLHMFFQHFVVEGGLRTYVDVVTFIRNPLIFGLETLFLVSVTTHALLGVRAVLFDLGLSDATEKLITQALWVVGALTVVYGLWLSWTIASVPLP